MKTLVTILLALIAGVVAKAVAQKLFQQNSGWLAASALFFVVVLILSMLFRKGEPPARELTPEQRASLVTDQGLSALMVAAADGDLPLVISLIAGGHDVNEISNIGTTALMYAARNNRRGCVDALLAAGADPSVKTKSGSTAHSFAEAAGSGETLELLAKK